MKLRISYFDIYQNKKWACCSGLLPTLFLLFAIGIVSRNRSEYFSTSLILFFITFVVSFSVFGICFILLYRLQLCMDKLSTQYSYIRHAAGHRVRDCAAATKRQAFCTRKSNYVISTESNVRCWMYGSYALGWKLWREKSWKQDVYTVRTHCTHQRSVTAENVPWSFSRG